MANMPNEITIRNLRYFDVDYPVNPPVVVPANTEFSIVRGFDGNPTVRLPSRVHMITVDLEWV